MPEVYPRRPYDGAGSGTESFESYACHNRRAVEWFLTHHQTFRSLIAEMARVEERRRLEITG